MLTDKLKKIVDALDTLGQQISGDFEKCYEDQNVFFDLAKEFIELMGGQKIGQGFYSDVYVVDGVCIKVSTGNDFSKLPIGNKFFQKWFPKVFAAKRNVCACEYLQLEMLTPTVLKFWEGSLVDEAFVNDTELHDLCSHNIQKDKDSGRIYVIDYGCWGNLNQ
jgi:hypothetical protein